jgi:2-hydroxychromene-2-carboxylate isomerase
MTVKTAIVSRVAGYLTSEAALNKRRRDTEKERARAGEAHGVDFFVDPDDPYSYLLLQLMPALVDRYGIDVKYWLVGPPEDAAAPDRSRLATWSERDAAMLAARAGLNPGRAPLPATLDRANVTAGNARRTECGHYLGGVLHYGGETYWGIDRLHYLEERLTMLGLRRDGGDAPLYAPPPDFAGPVATPSRETIHWYLSFRSPYTWLSAPRIAALAAAHGAKLELRFVLPMVMRSLPVPKEKRRYITLDTAREARRLGIPFGKVADPVGRPVERGYSLLPWAREQGRGLEFATAFLRAVWSQGVDAGSDSGMKRIVTATGLPWREAQAIIGNDDWRAEAEANRSELLDLGLWGVPSFRVGNEAVWGQDRIWAVDAMLRR